MMATAISILGIFAFPRLAVSLLPSFAPPVVTVTINYTNVAPATIETTVTRPVEDAVSRVPGIDFLQSDSFEGQSVASSGIVPMPSPSEKVVGGHAVVLVGYNDAVDRFRVRNSWGTGWGQNGYFEIPYLYVTSGSLASDFWVVQQTSA